MPVLENGFIDRSLKTKWVQVINTCAFDSLFSIFLGRYIFRRRKD